MSTRVYGASDDLIEFNGDVYGEVGFYDSNDTGPGCLLMFSDSTVLEAKYGKDVGAIWELRLLRKGSLFVGIEQCVDEDAAPHSDVATFKDGLKWAYAAKEWEAVS